MIGNDVVDLRDAEARPGATSARFDARVFAPAERARLDAADRPDHERWRLWAAKEAAFKAAKRARPDLVFAPSRFCVEPRDAAHGRVTIEGRSFEVVWTGDDDAVHAVASLDGAGGAIVAARRAAGEDPSLAARRLAVETVAAALGLPAEAIGVATSGRVPALAIGERRIPLSLSHHGEMVAFAALGRER